MARRDRGRGRGTCCGPGRTTPSEPHDSVRIEGVTKTYPNGKHALEDVDLVVPEGDFVFLVGPSGAGKSTLIKLLVRDEKADERARRGRGLRPRRPSRAPDVPAAAPTIGIVFQDFRLLPRKTVRENVAFALEVTGTPARGHPGRPSTGCSALVGLTGQARPATRPALRWRDAARRPSPGPWSTTRA